jgi:3'(2'), 5'-bisphosphate nucleotidase
MDFKPWQHEFDVALRAVRDAAILARDVRRQVGDGLLFKTDRSPVTIADFAVQAVIARRLADELPGDGLVAEETSASLRSPEQRPVLESVVVAVQQIVPGLAADEVLHAIDRGAGAAGGRFWTLDPVDGTKGFLRGGQYVVALALIVGGQVQIGILGCPELLSGSIVFAVRNRGAFRTPLAGDGFTPLHVSSCREPRLARVIRSVEDDHISVDGFNRAFRALAVEVPPVLMDSQAKHAAIAAGEADLLLRLPAPSDFRDAIWDQAAGALVVEQAGGRVTDLRGAALDFGAGRTLARNEGVVASNGHLHAAALESLRLRERS